MGEQPTLSLNLRARHSSHTANIILNDFVILADLNPLSLPIRSSLLQLLYGSCDKRATLLKSKFLMLLCFLACWKNSGVKSGL